MSIQLFLVEVDDDRPVNDVLEEAPKLAAEIGRSVVLLINGIRLGVTGAYLPEDLRRRYFMRRLSQAAAGA